MDRLEAMRIVVGVAEQSSFAEAARRLRISTAAASRAVAMLEDELGVSLFARTTRTVRLTERGALYLEHCRRILADVEDAARLVRGDGAEPRGQLTVTAPLMFGRLHVLPVVERLIAEHPKLSVRLLLSDRNAHLVDEGIDIAVRIGELADSAMLGVKVGALQRVTAASPAYLAARGTPETPDALRHHDIVAFEGIGSGNEWRFSSGERTITVQVEPRLSVNSADAAILAAANGLGITRTLSYQVAEAVRAGQLSIVLQAFAPPPQPVSLVYPARRIASANVTAFLDAARRYFRDTPIAPT